MGNNIELDFDDGTRAHWMGLSDDQMDKVAEFIEANVRPADGIRT